MKKKNKFIFLATLSTACLLSLASCQGAQGPKGDQGDPGINGTNGTNGKDGEPGEDGNSVRTGKGVPASSLGKDGDSYIDTETFDFYVKSNGAWSKEGNIKGASGDAGSQGEAGTKGEDGTSIRNGKGAPADTLGNDGDCYIDLSTFDFYVKADGKWSKEGNIKGEKGEAGEKGDKGDKGNPGSTGSQGKDGATAWSNTILPTSGGYVTVNKGSAVEGDYVTFTFVPNSDTSNIVTSLTLNEAVSGKYKDANESSIQEGRYIDAINNDNQLTVPMVAGGYVVKAEFGTAKKDVPVVGSDGKGYTDLNAAIKAGVNGAKLYKEISLTDDITIAKDKKFDLDLNGFNLIANSKTITVLGEFNVTNTGENEAYIQSNDDTKQVIVVGESTSINGLSSLNNGFSGGLSVLSRTGLRTYDNTVNAKADYLSIGKKVIVKSSGKAAAISVQSTTASVSVGEGASVQNVKDDASAKAIEVLAGSVEVSGSVNASTGIAVEVKPSSDNAEKTGVTVNSGATVSGASKAVSVAGGSLNVSGKVESENGTAVEVTPSSSDVKTEVNVKSGGEVSTTSGSAVTVSGGSVTVAGNVSSSASEKAAIEVKDGSVKVSGTVSAENGTAVKVTKEATADSTSASVTVSTGAQVSGSKAVEIDAGEIKVEGGTVSGSTNAIEVKGGSVEVNNGTVESTSTTAAAISVVQTDNTTTSTSVTVNGGSIESNGGSAVSVSKEASVTGSQTVKVNLDGGSYSTNGGSVVDSTNASASATVTKEESKIKYGVKTELIISDTGSVKADKETAGINESVVFTFTPNSGYAIKQVLVNGEDKTTAVKDNKLSVTVAKEGGLTVKVKYVNAALLDSVQGSDSKKYETVDEAFEAGCTSVTLLKDSVLENDLILKDQNLTLNLGTEQSHTLKVKDGKKIKVLEGSELEIAGKGKVSGGNFDGKNEALISLYSDEGTTANKIKIDKDVVIDAVAKTGKEVTGIAVFDSYVNLKTVVDVYGEVKTSNGLGITVTGDVKSTITHDNKTINFAVDDTIVNVYDGAKVTATKGVALYQGGFSKFNVYGGTFSGSEAALEVRAGTTNIIGGDFTATDTEFKVAPNGSGTTCNGAALAVTQHTTKEEVKVTVNGGTFKGIKGLYAANVQKNSEEDIKKVSITLNGGTFTGTGETSDKADIDVRDGIKCTVGESFEHGDNVNGIDGHVFVSTGAELKSALENKDVKYVKLTSDITDLNDVIELNAGQNVTLDFNNHTIKHNPVKGANGSYPKLFVTSNSSSLTMKNGKVLTDSDYTDNSSVSIFSANSGSSIICDHMYIDTSFTAFFPKGDAAKIEIKNSTVKAGSYAAATNAGSASNYNVVINIENSTLQASTSTGGSCAVMINVGGSLNITGSTIIGQSQGVIVRAGTATIKDSTIQADLSISDKDAYVDKEWSQGTGVASYPLVVGDTSATAYNANAVCNLEGVTIKNTCTESAYQDRCVYLAKDTSQYTTTLTYDEECKFGTAVLSESNFRTASGATVTITKIEKKGKEE